MKAFATLLLAFCASLAVAAPPVVSSFAPGAATPGMQVIITGTNFTGATAVSFGGTAAASFTVASATQINAIVGLGTSGLVQVTTADGSGTKAGFVYLPTSGIVTDFGGYWPATAASPNSIVPDDSHNLLAFTYNGITYSTGVNNAVLNTNGVGYTAGSFRALPVAGITGTTGNTSTYLALAKKVDGSATVANTPAVASFSIRTVLTDGPNGLNLGTGITNLPTSAILSFQIYSIDPTKINDNEPDVLLTQIAQPVTGNDVFAFVDAAGNVVGNSFSQDMYILPKFGSYDLDLFNLTPSTPYNSATAYSVYATNTNREIRLVALRLSDFGVTPTNASTIKALRITPSGNSDYGFVAYNTAAINLPPNVVANDAATRSTICSGGTAQLAVVGAAAGSGSLSYAWEQSTNSGTNWTAVANGGAFSGAATNTLSVANPANGYQYRCTVTESGNPNTAISTAFAVVVSSPAAPSSVTVSGGASVCLNSAVQLTSSVTGGSNLTYQWQSNASGSYQDISGATLNSYVPPTSQTGAVSYNVKVNSGSGCGGTVSATTAATVTVTGVAGTTPAARCDAGSLTLGATATSGTLDWYAADAGGTTLYTGINYTTPSLASSQTYYVMTSGCSGASVLRVPVTATVYPQTAGGSISGGTTVTSGTNSTTLTLNGHTGSVVKWQSSTDNFNTVVTDIAVTSLQYTATNLSQTTKFRALVQSGSCTSAFSSAATVNVSGVLAVNDRSIRAVPVAEGIRVEWTSASRQRTTAFVVERSRNGTEFTTVHTASPVNRGAEELTQAWSDKTALPGENFYRIAERLDDGTLRYSIVAKALWMKTSSSISLWPNPVQNRTVYIRTQDLKGSYDIQLLNSEGRMITATQTVLTGGMQETPLALPATTAPGAYLVQLTNSKGIIWSGKAVVL